MFYIKLKGFVPINKKMEFEQTFKLVSTQISNDCLLYNINNPATDGIYQFISYWDNKETLCAFTISPAFIILIGAFKTLGELRDQSIGEVGDISFEIFPELKS
jgi:hypothetical protein